MEDLSFISQYPFVQALIYVIIFVIGGVFYKYFKLLLEDRHITQEVHANSNQHLIENLRQRLDKMSIDLDKFEKEKTEVHKRELIRERELAQSQARVEILSYKIEELSKAVNHLTDIIGKYEKKYGKLDEEA